MYNSWEDLHKNTDVSVQAKGSLLKGNEIDLI